MKRWIDDTNLKPTPELVEIANKSVSIQDFARKTRLSWVTARSYNDRWNLGVPDGRAKRQSGPNATVEAQRNADIYKKWKAGLGYAELGRTYDLTRQRIYAIVQTEQKRVASDT